MKDTDGLIPLIRSMNKSEKRYFKLSSQLQSGNKIYLDLFDHIGKSKLFDEREFKSRHGNKKHAQNLAWRKHHLYDNLLSSLEGFHHSAEANVHSLLHRTEILFDKLLFRSCLKTLAKAKKIVLAYEMFPLLFEVIRWQETVAIRLSDMKLQQEAAANNEEAYRLFMNAYQQKNFLNRIYTVHNRLGFFRNKKDEQEIADVLTNDLWKKEEHAYSLKAQRYFHYSHFIYYFMKGDLEKGYEHCKKGADTFFKHPSHITYNPHVFMNSINSLLYCCSSLHRYAEMKAFLDQFKAARKYFSKAHLAASLLLSYHELDYYSATGKLKEGVIAARIIEKELASNEQVLSSLERTGLLINLAFTCFVNDKFRETIGLLNKVMREQALDSRIDMDSMVRTFFIIAHYEKGASKNFMRSLVRSAYRRLLKQKNLHRYERLILNFIRMDLVNADSDEKLIKAFRELREKLLKLKEDAYEGRPLEYFDLIAWLTSKIEGRSFAEMIRRNTH